MTTTFQVPFFPEITSREQLAAMSKTRLGEILFRTGHSRNQSCTKAELVDLLFADMFDLL